MKARETQLKNLLSAGVIFILLISCSIEQFAYKKAAEILGASGDSKVFTGEEDPVIVAESLPLLLKLYELVLEKNPENSALQITAGSMFVMYANAFVQGPAELLDDDEYETIKIEMKRAKLHYQRGKKHTLKGIELDNSELALSIRENDLKGAYESIGIKDCKAVYWYAAATLGAFSTNPLDLELSLEMPCVFACLIKSVEIDEEYGDGVFHEMLMSVYQSLPANMYMSADSETALWMNKHLTDYYGKFNISDPNPDIMTDFHYRKALELSDGFHAGLYLAYAAGTAVSRNDRALYKELLEKVISLDIDRKPESRLANTIARQKAVKMLSEMDDIFF